MTKNWSVIGESELSAARYLVTHKKRRRLRRLRVGVALYLVGGPALGLFNAIYYLTGALEASVIEAVGVVTLSVLPAAALLFVARVVDRELVEPAAQELQELEGASSLSPLLGVVSPAAGIDLH